MDYRAYLKNPLSLGYIDKLVQIVELHPQDFQTIYELIFDNDFKVAWRAAWACQKICEKQKTLFTDKQFNELATLCISTSHDGVRRGCLSILFQLPIPQLFPVDLLNACFEWMNSPKQPIAVQAISLKLLHRFCEIEPDLKPELIAYLDNYSTADFSPGMISVRRKVIKSLLNK